MAPALVQVASGSGSGVSTVTAQFTTTNDTAGNTIIVAIFDVGSANVSSVTDSEGNSYPSADVGQVAIPFGAGFIQVWSSPGIIGGTKDTVTVHRSSGTGACQLYIHEVSGLLTTANFDKSHTGTGSNQSPTSGATVALSQALEFIFGFIRSDSNVVTGAGGTWADGVNDSTNHSDTQWEAVNSTTGVATTGTISSSGSSWAAIVATYKGLASTIFMLGHT